MIMYSLFPIPVMRLPASSNYDEIQIEVKSAIEQIKKDEDYSTVTYLYKQNNINIDKKKYNFLEKYNCVKLKQRIELAAKQYIDNVGWMGIFQTESKISIENSWLNIMEYDTNHSNHCHPGYKISGCYYFRVNEKQGSISFNNPNPLMFACEFPQGIMSPQATDIVPSDGDIILFPSWLVHSTRKNMSDEERISVAFNIDFCDVSNERVRGLVKGSHIPYISRETPHGL